jgi:uncharacterized protein
MRITIFGAAGTVGSRVVTEALTRDHRVTAVVRHRSRLPRLHPAADPRIGDATNVEDVTRLSTDQDLVISATRPTPGNERELVTAAQALLTGLRQTGVRLLLVGGAGSLTVPNSGGVRAIDDPAYVPPPWRPIALACDEQLKACHAETTVDWAYLSPPALLEPGRRTGQYRRGTDEMLVDAQGTSTISIEDFAVALLDEAELPKHHQARFTVAY